MDLFAKIPGTKIGEKKVGWTGPKDQHPKFTTPDPLAGEVAYCKKCGGQKQRTFYLSNTPKKKHQWGWSCKPCRKKSHDEWRQKDYVKKHLKTRQEWRGQKEYYRNYWTPEKWRNQKLKKQYGITLEDYERMLAEQGGVCAICGKFESRKLRGKVCPMPVDHCHATGKTRGILCVLCNFALYRLDADKEWGAKALRYIARYEGA